MVPLALGDLIERRPGRGAVLLCPPTNSSCRLAAARCERAIAVASGRPTATLHDKADTAASSGPP
jgi:hypothetical protein